MPGKKRATKEPGVARVVVNNSLYPQDVVFGAAFTFLDRAYLHLDVVDENSTSVEIRPRPGQCAETLAGEFDNELVTQAVRLRLARETSELRTMIVGRAIGEAQPRQPRPAAEPELPPEIAKILAEEEESLDFLDDPLGIAVPWEEKFGKEAQVSAPAEAPSAEPSPAVEEPAAPAEDDSSGTPSEKRSRRKKES